MTVPDPITLGHTVLLGGHPGQEGALWGCSCGEMTTEDWDGWPSHHRQEALVRATRVLRYLHEIVEALAGDGYDDERVEFLLLEFLRLVRREGEQ